ncbi:MAG: alpha/beta hydrolase [Chloroflexota bacterium]
MNTEALPQVIPLWSDGTSESGIGDQREQETVIPSPRFNNSVKNMKVVRNITQPTLTAYLPAAAAANGAAVVICPGGGFTCLPIEIEGADVARWLNRHGIAAFVLNYRLLPTAIDDETFIQQMQRPDMAQINAHIPLAVTDGKRAVSLVREHAAEWNLDPQRIGTLGFSAGGVVATGAAVQSDPDGDIGSRPNFVASLYSPGVPDLMPQADILPLFLAFASDDPVLKLVSEGSLRLYSAWKDAHHPVELHIYSKGGHGFGMTQQNLPCDHWIDRFGDWLHVEGLLI